MAKLLTPPTPQPSPGERAMMGQTPPIVSPARRPPPVAPQASQDVVLQRGMAGPPSVPAFQPPPALAPTLAPAPTPNEIRARTAAAFEQRRAQMQMVPYNPFGGMY